MNKKLAILCCALLVWSAAAFALALVAAEPDTRLAAPPEEPQSGAALAPGFGGVVPLAANDTNRAAAQKGSPAAPSPCDC